ncbi:MAG: methyltransferase domain-containing protein [Candidatus Sumerlaeia bacterium]
MADKPPSGGSAPNSMLRKNPPAPRTLGPVSDLERHLPSDWWRNLFNSLYLKTDGDVVENPQNTQQDIDLVEKLLKLEKDTRVLDLCCGQGRHSLELARRAYRELTGMDRSRYLIRQAKKRAQAENLSVNFNEGDARKIRPSREPYDCVIIMGNSFGYFEQPQDDAAVLKSVTRILKPGGRILMDLVDGDWMKKNFEPRSWEWIDQNHFVCRERSLSNDGHRIISREVITHAEKGVIADQFYAERLYNARELRALLQSVGFESIHFHEAPVTASSRNQDLGMMAHRLILTASTPFRRPVVLKPTLWQDITVLLGDPRLGDQVKLNGQFNEEDFATIRKMQEALGQLEGFHFHYYDHHDKFLEEMTCRPPQFVLNLCDEGYMNDAFKELHVPAVLEMLNIPYTGAGPAALGLCYNKGLISAVAQSLDIPVPLESYIGPDDSLATLPSTFPVLIKPNFGDSSIGITKRAVVHNTEELMEYIDWLRNTYGRISILIQEYLEGPEYSIGIVGNPGLSYKVLAPLEVDFSMLPPGLPPILGYESKWDPKSPYWTAIRCKPAEIDDERRRKLLDYSNLLFERTGCRDYARFDFRCDGAGTIKLMEVNPNPGWCWDGKMNFMAGFEDMSYSDLLGMIINAAQERLGQQHSVKNNEA